MTGIISRLAPGPVDPDPQWAAETLRRIKASKVPRRRRRTFIGAGLAGGVLLGGGVAVAQSAFAPDPVTRSIQGLQERVGLGSTTEPVKIADIHLSDGTRWQVWRGFNDQAGSCWTAGDPSRGAVETDLANATCDYMPPEGDQEDSGMLGNFARFGFYDEDERDGLPVVYGQVTGSDVKAVHVVGPGYQKTVRPDATTGGFGFELPWRTAHRTKNYLFDGMRIEYLDDAGRIVQRGE